jgi:hypothetical protein
VTGGLVIDAGANPPCARLRHKDANKQNDNMELSGMAISMSQIT